MLGRPEFLQAGHLMRQLGWLVDQDGQVLRANPEGVTSILDLDQGHLVLIELAINAGGLE